MTTDPNNRLPKKVGRKKIKDVRLRGQARLAFMTSETSMTVEELHQDPRFSGIPLSRFKRWATKDNWVEERMDFVERWVQSAAQKLENRLTEERLDELKILVKLREEGLVRLYDPELKVRSWEGMAKSVLDVMKYTDVLRSNLKEEAVRAIEAGPPPSERPVLEPEVPFTEFELDTLSSQLLNLRRATIETNVDSSSSQSEADTKSLVVHEPSGTDSAS